jgi:hypothetical protein
MTDLHPNSLDYIVRDSRSRLDRIRKLFPDPQDFEHYAKRAVRETLEAKGFNRKTINETMYAVFGEKEITHGKVAR